MREEAVSFFVPEFRPIIKCNIFLLTSVNWNCSVSFKASLFLQAMKYQMFHRLLSNKTFSVSQKSNAMAINQELCVEQLFEGG